eukprot:750005-Hanusia_phi.AAC.1
MSRSDLQDKTKMVLDKEEMVAMKAIDAKKADEKKKIASPAKKKSNVVTQEELEKLKLKRKVCSSPSPLPLPSSVSLLLLSDDCPGLRAWSISLDQQNIT